MFSFRNSKKEDFDLIANFTEDRTELFFMYPKGIYPIEPRQLFEVSTTRYLPTVIEYAEEIVGYSNFYDLEEGEQCWLGNVIINSRFRGKGAGKFLVNTMIERARNELKVKKLGLVCHNTNTRALLLYHKMGFKPYEIKTISDYNKNEIAGIKMIKDI